MSELTPASVKALLDGDLENFLAASTPGGIEAQEAAGQAKMVAASYLPGKISNKNVTEKAIEQAWGIKFGGPYDDIFRNVTLPAEWSIRSSEHSMYSYLVDSDGCVRANIFYKAAFYDRCAHMHIVRRYTVEDDWGKPESLVKIRDNKTGECLRSFGPFAQEQYDLHDKYEEDATAWLNENLPNHLDCLAYWK